MGGLGVLIVAGALSPFAAFGAAWAAGRLPERKVQSGGEADAEAVAAMLDGKRGGTLP